MPSFLLIVYDWKNIYFFSDYFSSATPQKAREQKKEDIPGLLVSHIHQIHPGDHIYCQVDNQKRHPALVLSVDVDKDEVKVHLYRWPRQGAPEKLFTRDTQFWVYGLGTVLAILPPPLEVPKGRVRVFYRFPDLEKLVDDQDQK